MPPVKGEARQVYEIDFGKVTAFTARYDNKRRTGMDGTFPAGWAAQSWREGATAEIGTYDHNGVRGTRMLTTTGTGGSGEIQTLWNQSPFHFVSGQEYLLRTDFAIVGTKPGRFEVRFNGEKAVAKTSVVLQPTRGEWQTAYLRFTAPENQHANTYFTHGGVAPDFMMVRSVKIFDYVEGATPQVSQGTYQLNLANIKPFARRYKLDTVVESQGESGLPAPWAAETTDAQTLGDVFIDKVGQYPAIGIRNHEGPPSVRIFAKSDLLPVKAGKKYAVKLWYQTEDKGQGWFTVSVGDKELKRTNMPIAAGSWKEVEITVTAPADGSMTMAIGCESVGSESSVFVRSIEIREVQ